MNGIVIGSGAVGLGLGSCLLAAGERVTFVTRRGGAGPLREEGLRRTGLFGEARFPPEAFGAVDSLDALADAAVDFALVCTKTFDAEPVARALARVWERLGPAPRVVVAQNGWGTAEVFARWLPRERVFNARVITGFRRVAPNAVEITVHAEPIRLGSLFGSDPRELAPLAHAIDKGGIPCELSPEIARDLWAKLLYSCSLNPLGALLGVPYGVLAGREDARRVIEQVVREIFAVMRAHGYATHWPDADAYLRVFYRELIPSTASHESSMLQDLRAGRRTEIDALCGAVAELGARAGVPTPVNAALRDLLRARR